MTVDKLEVRNVSLAFGENQVLRDVSIHLKEGELVCRYDQWNWQEGLWLEADGLRRVDWNWADGLPTVETEYTTVYIRP